MVYSRTRVTRTVKENKKQFELVGLELSGSIEYSMCQVKNW